MRHPKLSRIQMNYEKNGWLKCQEHIFCSLVTRQDTVKPAHLKEPILVSQNGTRPIQVVFQTVPPSDFK